VGVNPAWVSASHSPALHVADSIETWEGISRSILKPVVTFDGGVFARNSVFFPSESFASWFSPSRFFGRAKIRGLSFPRHCSELRMLIDECVGGMFNLPRNHSSKELSIGTYSTVDTISSADRLPP